MNHVKGITKLQLQMSSLENSIDKENPYKFIPVRLLFRSHDPSVKVRMYLLYN